MQTHRLLTPLLFLAALVAAFAVACGGDSDSSDTMSTPAVGDTPAAGQTVDPEATINPSNGDEPDETANGATPTEDPLAREAERAIRDVERAIGRLNSRVRVLTASISQSGFQLGDGEEEPIDDWFEECCDDAQRDISEEIRDANAGIATLVGIYDETGDSERLAIAQRLGDHTANLEASITVLAQLPTPDGAGPILEDLGLELQAFADTLASLG